jgi:hypothetical protein
MRALTAGSGGLLAVMLASSVAAADPTRQECLAAHTQAQDLRRDGKLSAARDQRRRCSESTCPGMVKSDCTTRLDELERAQPTIAFVVKDASGKDVTSVSVTMDGKPWAAALEGKALNADPGKHVFVFTIPGVSPIEQSFVLTEGEKGRRERVVVESPRGSQQAPTQAEPSPPPPPPVSPTKESTPEAPPGQSGGMGTGQVVGLAVGTVGILGLGAGGVFGFLTSSAWSKAKTDCGGSTTQCTNVSGGNSDRNTALTDATISTVGFIAGGALLVTGAVLVLTGGNGKKESTTGLVVSPTLGPGEGGVAVMGRF